MLYFLCQMSIEFIEYLHIPKVGVIKKLISTATNKKANSYIRWGALLGNRKGWVSLGEGSQLYSKTRFAITKDVQSL